MMPSAEGVAELSGFDVFLLHVSFIPNAMANVNHQRQHHHRYGGAGAEVEEWSAMRELRQWRMSLVVFWIDFIDHTLFVAFCGDGREDIACGGGVASRFQARIQLLRYLLDGLPAGTRPIG